jgi:hypothetical protein
VGAIYVMYVKNCAFSWPNKLTTNYSVKQEGKAGDGQKYCDVLDMCENLI